MHNRSTLFGDSCFTTAKVINGAIEFYADHIERLKNTAAYLGISFDVERCKALMAEKLLSLDLSKVYRFRISVCRLSNSLSPIVPEAAETLITLEAEVYKPKVIKKVGISPVIVAEFSKLAGYKTGNYLEKIMALQLAHKAGQCEALQFNSQNVLCSAIMANVFIVDHNDQWFTPSLTTGCLPGIQRKHIMQQHNVIERDDITLAEVQKSKKIYLTNSLIGLAAVELV